MRTSVHTVRLSVLIFFLAFFTNNSYSQSLTTGNGKIEAGVGLGPMFFLGDLGGSYGIGTDFVKDIDFPLTKLNKGIYLNVYPTEWLGIRLAGNLSYIKGDDAQAPDKGGAERYRLKRNLKFESKISEAYAAIEIYPTVFFEQYDGLAHKLRPYVVGGAGIFHFNPKAEYTEPGGTKRMVELKPLRLEGQGFSEYPDRKEYSLTQKELLVGGGLKYYLSESMYVGFEILHRKTFSDYIDDISTKYINPALFNTYLSAADAAVARQLYYRENLLQPGQSRPNPVVNEQRGDSKDNDAFFSSILRMGWRLNGANSPTGRAKRQLKCPVYY